MPEYVLYMARLRADRVLARVYKMDQDLGMRNEVQESAQRARVATTRTPAQCDYRFARRLIQDFLLWLYSHMYMLPNQIRRS